MCIDTYWSYIDSEGSKFPIFWKVFISYKSVLHILYIVWIFIIFSKLSHLINPYECFQTKISLSILWWKWKRKAAVWIWRTWIISIQNLFSFRRNSLKKSLLLFINYQLCMGLLWFIYKDPIEIFEYNLKNLFKKGKACILFFTLL